MPRRRPCRRARKGWWCSITSKGNRTPYTDANARGVISGLTLKHGPAHLYRAMIEGVSFGTVLIFETMRANGFSPKEVVICGGGSTRSDLWMQIHADTAGLPLVLTEVADAPALALGDLAAVGAGSDSDMIEASDAMVRVVKRIEPDRARHAAYQPFYEATSIPIRRSPLSFIGRRASGARDQRGITTLDGQAGALCSNDPLRQPTRCGHAAHFS